MPRNGSGVFSLAGSLIAHTDANAEDVMTILEDIRDEITNSVAKDGQATLTGSLKAAGGTAAAPSITFGGDTDTGLFRKSANVIGVSANGAEVVEISATGAKITGNVEASGTILAADGDATAPSVAFTDDDDTGFFRKGDGDIGVAINGVEVGNIDENGLNLDGDVKATGNVEAEGNVSADGAIDAGGGFTVNGAAAAYVSPGGRLTLSTGTPVLTADVTGATTIYYTPYLHGFASLYNGTTWKTVQFAELSQALSDNTKSPAATTGDNQYDMFLWDDNGTIRCTRGPAWSSGTDRGTGAGTTEIARVVNGIYVNAVAITNGPAAGYGLYVGTIRTNNSNQVPMTIAPSPATGGSANQLFVWNMFNRVEFTALVRDSTASWNTATTLRAWNNSNGNRATFVRGLDEDSMSARLSGRVSVANNGNINFGIGIDATNAFASRCRPWGLGATSSTFWSFDSTLDGPIGLGLHYLQMLEQGPTDAANVGRVTTSGQLYQSGMEVRFRA